MNNLHFTFAEMIYSETATKYGIINIPSWTAIHNLSILINRVLEPARLFLGVPINVHSGYRSIDLNKKIGGSTSSQHMLGQAADISTEDDYKRELLFNYIKSNLVFDQLIRYDTFIHVSYAEGFNRKEILDFRSKTEKDI